MIPFRHTGIVTSQNRNNSSFKVIGTVVGILIDVRTVFTLERFTIVIERKLSTYAETVVSSTYPSDTRIERIEEALDFGAEEYLSSGELCLVEWPEKIEPLLPDDTMVVKIEILSPTARRFVIR